MAKVVKYKGQESTAAAGSYFVHALVMTVDVGTEEGRKEYIWNQFRFQIEILGLEPVMSYKPYSKAQEHRNEYSNTWLLPQDWNEYIIKRSVSCLFYVTEIKM